MSRVLLLLPQSEQLVDGNYLRFCNGLMARDHEIVLAFTDTLRLTASRVLASGWVPDRPLKPNQQVPALTAIPAGEFDLCWLFSLGKRESFLDKFQMLYSLGPRTRFVNSLDSIMHLKSKYFITSQPDLIRHPETHASTDPEHLLQIVETSSHAWVAKPPAGSLGRDVFVLKPGGPNNRAILQNLCGREEDQYTLLQQYVSEVTSGEKRVLFAGGKVIGQYRRTATGDHRTNLIQGATSTACDLSEAEAIYCRTIGQVLTSMGAGFVGIDLIYPWVIEFNVINPGGITTIDELTGVDLTNAVLDSLEI